MEKKGPDKEEYMCPICLYIMVEPVTMPCRHSLCLPCYKQTVEKTNLCCPICRLRISVWARTSSKKNTLVDQHKWEIIQKYFPDKVRQRLEGGDGPDEVEGDDSDSDDYATQLRKLKELSKPGEIRQEYEAALEKLQRQKEEEARREEEASAALIRSLQQEEEKEMEELDRQREELERLGREAAEQLVQNPGFDASTWSSPTQDGRTTTSSTSNPGSRGGSRPGSKVNKKGKSKQTNGPPSTNLTMNTFFSPVPRANSNNSPTAQPRRATSPYPYDCISPKDKIFYGISPLTLQTRSDSCSNDEAPGLGDHSYSTASAGRIDLTDFDSEQLTVPRTDVPMYDLSKVKSEPEDIFGPGPSGMGRHHGQHQHQASTSGQHQHKVPTSAQYQHQASTSGQHQHKAPTSGQHQHKAPTSAQYQHQSSVSGQPQHKAPTSGQHQHQASTNGQRIVQFQPIIGCDRTPPKRLASGQVVDPPLVRALPRNLKAFVVVTAGSASSVLSIQRPSPSLVSSLPSSSSVLVSTRAMPSSKGSYATSSSSSSSSLPSSLNTVIPGKVVYTYQKGNSQVTGKGKAIRSAPVLTLSSTTAPVLVCNAGALRSTQVVSQPRVTIERIDDCVTSPVTVTDQVAVARGEDPSKRSDPCTAAVTATITTSTTTATTSVSQVQKKGEAVQTEKGQSSDETDYFTAVSDSDSEQSQENVKACSTKPKDICHNEDNNHVAVISDEEDGESTAKNLKNCPEDAGKYREKPTGCSDTVKNGQTSEQLTEQQPSCANIQEESGDSDVEFTCSSDEENDEKKKRKTDKTVQNETALASKSDNQTGSVPPLKVSGKQNVTVGKSMARTGQKRKHDGRATKGGDCATSIRRWCVVGDSKPTHDADKLTAVRLKVIHGKVSKGHGKGTLDKFVQGSRKVDSFGDCQGHLFDVGKGDGQSETSSRGKASEIDSEEEREKEEAVIICEGETDEMCGLTQEEKDYQLALKLQEMYSTLDKNNIRVERFQGSKDQYSLRKKRKLKK